METKTLYVSTFKTLFNRQKNFKYLTQLPLYIRLQIYTLWISKIGACHPKKKTGEMI